MSQSLIPAAQYVRMSKEDQKYSISNQEQAIADYAAQNGYSVVATFSDPGISGLDLKHRPGLRNLLEAVVRNPTFTTILVLDVSRWGRFQDIDESAYYEFLCRRAGVQIRYCGETFENDHSPLSNLLKAIKRTMAAEYSRELSVKVFRGHSRLAMMGYKQGGIAGVGLRRLLVDENGKPKQLLAFGERKSLVSDRVILVPGPAAEAELVRAIFEWVRDGRSPNSIAKELAAKNVLGITWTKHIIYRMMRHPKYMGVHVYNRTTTKLKSTVVHNPPEKWITKPGAFVPLISPELFKSVQERLANFTMHLSNEEMLRRLRQLYLRDGYLTRINIDKSREVPSVSAYAKRFGSLRSAVQQVGLTDEKAPFSKERRIAELRRKTWHRLKDALREHGTHLQSRSQEPYYIQIPGVPLLKVIMAHPLETGGKRRAWQIYPSRPVPIKDSIVALLSPDGKEISEYMVIPPLTSERTRRYAFFEARIPYICVARFRSHLELFDALKRIRYVRVPHEKVR